MTTQRQTFNRISNQPSLSSVRITPFLLCLLLISLDDAKQKNGVCLVHCSHGMSRSVAFVLVYLMARQGMSLREALGFTRTRRPVASPNTGFMRLLVEEEKKTKESVSIDLEKYRENRFEEIENLAPK